MHEDPIRLWDAWRTRRDAVAFESLVLPELGRAVALARAEGCPHAEAEDAVQESLLRLAREAGPGPSRVGVRGWFFRVVRDRARARLLSHRRRRRREAGAAVPEVVDAGTSGLALREEVEKALEALPPEDREAVRLRYLLDLEYGEVAHVLGLSEGACRMRVHRALQRLRAVLGPGTGAMLAVVALPPPAHAASWVSATVEAASTAGAVTTGGIAIVTTAKKVALGSVVAGLAGTALGAGAARLAARAPESDAAVVLLRRERDAARASGEGAAADAAVLRRRVAELEEEVSRLRQGRASGTDARTGPAPAAAPAAPAPAPQPAPAAPAPPAADPDRETMNAARALLAGWVEDARQVKDPAKREAALAAIRSALESGETVRVLAGLLALRQLPGVPFDKEAMRALVLPRLESAEPLLRGAAVHGLFPTGSGADDATLLLRLCDDPSFAVRRELVSALSPVSRGDFTGAAGALLLRVADEMDAKVAVEGKGRRPALLFGLGGGYLRRVSPEVEARLLALARDPDPEIRQRAVRLFMNLEKTGPVLDLLIALVEEGRREADDIVGWIHREVPADQAPRVAALLARLLVEGKSHWFSSCLLGVESLGTPAELAILDREAANEMRSEPVRRSLEAAAARLRKRLGQ